MGGPPVRPSGRPQERAGNRQPRGMAITGATRYRIRRIGRLATTNFRPTESGLTCGNGEAQSLASREIAVFRNLLRPVCGLEAASARIPAGQRGLRHCLPASARKIARPNGPAARRSRSHRESRTTPECQCRICHRSTMRRATTDALPIPDRHISGVVPGPCRGILGHRLSRPEGRCQGVRASRSSSLSSMRRVRCSRSMTSRISMSRRSSAVRARAGSPLASPWIRS